MPRQLKPLQVDTYADDKNHITVPVFLNRNNNHFFADFAGTRYDAHSVNDIIPQLRKAVDAACTVEWHGLICVTPFKDSFGRSEHLFGFNLERKWVGRVAGGIWKASQWDAANARDGFNEGLADRRLEWSHNFGSFDKLDKLPNFPYRSRNGFSDNGYWLNYTEELWNNLIALQERIVQAKKAFDDLIGSEAGVSLISRGFMPSLLEAPQNDAQGQELPLLEGEVIDVHNE